MYGIVGYPLTHSFSPAYFNKKFETLGLEESYELFPIETIEDFKDILKANPELKGVNVTIPYKQTVIDFLDHIDATALAVGAVNCIKIEQGKTKGFNTDVTGFTDTLKPLLQPHHTAALILGTGGAAKAVAYALQQLGITYNLVSRNKRNGCLTYDGLDESIFQQHQLIINTTPAGMFPLTGNFPAIPYQFLNKAHLLYDLIYNPRETLFLQKGKAYGADTKNGYDMLIAQAEASWNIWTKG